MSRLTLIKKAAEKLTKKKANNKAMQDRAAKKNEYKADKAKARKAPGKPKARAKAGDAGDEGMSGFVKGARVGSDRLYNKLLDKEKVGSLTNKEYDLLADQRKMRGKKKKNYGGAIKRNTGGKIGTGKNRSK